MRMLKRFLPVVIALAVTDPATAQGANLPCSSEQHREFDFWIGEWNVYTPDGKLAGKNSIVREYGGCVLHERYDNGRGFSGESLNIYDASRQRWHQTWVDSSGMLLLLEGGTRDGRMMLEGRTTGEDGAVMQHRITWTQNLDGSVRQLWESTGKDGQWSVTFDGTYKRQ